MKIALVSKADSYGGGASRVAEELTHLLSHAGYTVHHWASWAGKGWSSTRLPLYGRFERHIRGAHFAVKKLGFPELIPFELAVLLRKRRILDYDLIHFHDLSSAISPVTLSVLSRIRPVVWTIHDCSPFTGGCLYPMGCEKYKTGCGGCPQIGEWPIDSRLDMTRLLHQVKRDLHGSGRVVMATPSRWMSDTAFASGLFQRAPEVVSNGIDTDLYVPSIDKAALRRDLGLPENRRIVLLSAGHILDERKGTRFAIEALRQTADLNPFLLLVGSLDDRAHSVLEGFDRCATGYVGDPAQLARFYGAADLFVFCSLADNQPLVVLETMATGTPTVGFATGGMTEMVVQDETGYLVVQRDQQALAGAIRRAFEDDRAATWGRNARRRVVDRYSHARLLAGHVELYERVLRGEFTIWRRQAAGPAS